MPRTKGKRTYRTVSLPEDLLGRIDDVIAKQLGYNSAADFVSDAVRRRLDELERIQLAGEEYGLEEKEVKHMGELEHVNLAVNGGKTVIAIKDHTDGRIYDVILSQSGKRVKLFCMGDESFDCVHVKYVWHVIVPKLKEYIELYKKKNKKEE